MMRYAGAAVAALLSFALAGCAAAGEEGTQMPESAAGAENTYVREAQLLTAEEESSGASDQENDSKAAQPDQYESLSVPTQVNKVGDTWFIVDCYHNQVIYNDNMGDPLTEWKVMTDDIDKGHTVAGDGVVYLVDDTEGERILVFEKSEGGFTPTQVFNDITDRPHCIIYDEATQTFYAWASTGGRMYLIRRGEENRMYIADTGYIPELDGVYVRSFTIIGDEIYFPTADGRILRADKESFSVKKEYKVPDAIGGLVQVIKIEDYYYITVSTDIVGFQDGATIVRCRSLEDLESGGYEDIYDNFIGGGTPYYISKIGSEYYLTEHRLPGHSVWRFTVEGDDIIAESLY